MTMMRLQLFFLSLLASLGHSFRPAIVSRSHTSRLLWVSQLPCTDDIPCVSKNNNDNNNNNHNHNEPSLDHVVPPSLLMGGDFVGLWLTANPTNGAIRPVPEHWVPEALLEWGQEPYALEIIVSEDNDDDNNNNNDDSTTRRLHWQRRTLTVLPETGCGVDNLEVVPRHDRDLQPIRVQKQQTTKKGEENDLATVCLISRLPNQMLALETILPDDDDDNDDDAPEHRVRLVVTLKTTTSTTDHDSSSSSSSLAIASVGLAWERRLDTVSSRGTRADGGGLDGQSVSRWMGETIRRAASSLHQVPSKQSHTSDNDDDDDIAWVRLPRHLSYALQQSFSNDEELSDTTTLTIRHGANNDETRETVVVWSIVGNGGEDVSCVVQ